MDLSRVQCTSVRCSTAQRDAVYVSSVHCSSEDVGLLSRVQRGSGGYSLYQQGAALLNKVMHRSVRVQRSSIGILIRWLALQTGQDSILGLAV